MDTLSYQNQIDLTPYPTLGRLIPSEWVTQHLTQAQINSEVTLAWWLSHQNEAGHILTTIDSVMRSLIDSQMEGIEQRLGRLWQDRAGFRETLVELYFAAWLLHLQIPFGLTSSGPDFSIGHEKSTFDLEVTSLRRTPCFPRLFEELEAAAVNAGYFVEYSYGPTTLELIDKAAIRNILNAWEELKRTSAGSKALTQEHLEYDLKIVWEPSTNTGAVATSRNMAPNDLFGAQLIFRSVRGKIRQMPDERPGCLAVEVGSDEHGHVRAFRSRINARDWSNMWRDIPGKIKHLYVFTTSLDQINPWDCMHLVNPNSTFTDPPELDETMERVFQPVERVTFQLGDFPLS